MVVNGGGKTKGSPVPSKANSLEAGGRTRLLAAAAARLSCQGYAGTSVRQVASDAGVTLPVLYYYFQSKEGLYVAVVNSQLEELHDKLVAAIDPHSHPITKIEDFSRTFYNQYISNSGGIGTFLVEWLAVGAPIRKILKNYDRAVVQPLATIVAEAVENGVFLPVTPRDCSQAIIALLLGFIRRQSLAFEECPFEVLRTQIIDLYCGGLLNRNAERTVIES